MFIIPQNDNPARFASSFSPTSIANLGLWYDFSNNASLTVAGGLISQVNDLSGNSRTGTSSGTNRPTQLTADQNGLNVAQFTAATSQYFAIPAYNLTFPYTVFAVYASPSGANGFIGLGNTSQTGTHDVQIIAATIYWGTMSTYGYGGASFSSGSTYTLATIQSTTNNTAGIVRANRSPLSPTWVSASGVGQVNYFGRASTTYATGKIGEYLHYGRALNSTEYANVENYLQAKWGTP